jgi:Uma2 family endonuclease
MSSRAAVILDEDVFIPPGISSLDHFRRWSQGDEFPERGRIDYLSGTLEVDLSPEDLYTHGAVKTALAAKLFSEVEEAGRGSVFVDRTRIVSAAAGLSAEPDIVVVLWRSLREGRVREVPSAGAGEGRFVELEGNPDLVVEILSDRSQRKDRERLPRLYAKAGIPELWTVDARGETLAFDVHLLTPNGYRPESPDAGGWRGSPLLGQGCRLARQRTELARWTYRLETKGRP